MCGCGQHVGVVIVLVWSYVLFQTVTEKEEYVKKDPIVKVRRIRGSGQGMIIIVLLDSPGGSVRHLAGAESGKNHRTFLQSGSGSHRWHHQTASGKGSQVLNSR